MNTQENQSLERVAIFIDGSNFYHAIRRAFNRTQIRFDALADKLTARVAGRKLVRVYYYNAVDTNAECYKKQSRFLESLRCTPYLHLKLGRLERCPIDWSWLHSERRKKVEEHLGKPLPEYMHVEKGVDVQMSVDMLHLAIQDSYDVAIIISGNGDFAPAVDAVKQLGKHVELGRVRDWPCNRLLDSCDVEVSIDENMIDGCWE